MTGLRNRYWHVVAADSRGAQWAFLVGGERPPTVSSVVQSMKTHGRVVELSGQIVDTESIDWSTVQVAGSDATIRRIRGGAPKYSIEGDPID